MRASGINRFLPFIVAALAFLATEGIRAQVVSKDDAKKLCDQFLEKVVKGDIKKAFNLIKPHIAVTDRDFREVIQETEKQRELISQRFGASSGFEMVQEQDIRGTLVKFIYIEKCRISVIRWSFIFYKPEDKWILNSFYWDENVRDLFK